MSMQTCGLVYFFQQTPRRGGRGIQWYSASVLEQTSMVKKIEHYDHLEITHRCSEENSALSEHLAIGGMLRLISLLYIFAFLRTSQ